MKIAAILLASTLAASAVDVGVTWENSVTPSTSNKLFVSRSPFQGRPITNALWSGMVGTTNRVRINLTTGLWRIAVCAVLNDVESEPCAIAIDVPSLMPVPEPQTGLGFQFISTETPTLQGMSTKHVAGSGHDRQRNR